MPARQPLQGLELIDCAKANAAQGLETATYQCGYDRDRELFMQNLQFACQEIGINVQQLGDLITEQQMPRDTRRIAIAPDTPSDL